MPFSSIALSVSGHGHEELKVCRAVDLATQLGARLHVVHVNDPKAGTVSFKGMDHGTRFDDQTLRAYIENECGRTLPENTVIDIETGDWVKKLVSLSNDVDLLVLGHHHVSFFTAIFADSPEEPVINNAHCPVLVVNDLPPAE